MIHAANRPVEDRLPPPVAHRWGETGFSAFRSADDLLDCVAQQYLCASLMNITEILKPGCVRVPLAATDKVAAITELVDLLEEQGLLTNRHEVLRAVLQREQTRSTGIGQGLAVPHGKSAGCATLTMAVGKPAQPIDFGAKDGQPCSLIALLVSPVDEMGPHIQALARISRLWLTDTFRADVAEANSAEAVFAAIQAHQD